MKRIVGLLIGSLVAGLVVGSASAITVDTNGRDFQPLNPATVTGAPDADEGFNVAHGPMLDPNGDGNPTAGTSGNLVIGAWESWRNTGCGVEDMSQEVQDELGVGSAEEAAAILCSVNGNADSSVIISP